MVMLAYLVVSVETQNTNLCKIMVSGADTINGIVIRITVISFAIESPNISDLLKV